MRQLAKQIVFVLTSFWLAKAAIPVDIGCPLELSNLNFTEAISACSEQGLGKCCRYVNALVGISIARYANATSQLGVSSVSSKACFNDITGTLQLNGFSPNATALCGLGTKILVNFHCKGRKTIQDMERTSRFKPVSLSCKGAVTSLGSCRNCLNASIVFLRHLVGAGDNMTLSTCMDATFVTIASHGDSKFAVDLASCFFGLRDLGSASVSIPKVKPASQVPSPMASPSPIISPISIPSGEIFLKEPYSTYHLTLVPDIGIGVTGVAFALLVLLILLIHRKRKELGNSSGPMLSLWNMTLAPHPRRQLHKWRGGPSPMFRRFRYKEIRMATTNFSSIIGRGGFGTVYKAKFKNGFVAAVKRMNTASQQGEAEFCKEMELLGRLHHCHLVALRGFCAEQRERFLVYEYMENGSLKQHLHSSTKPPLSWQARIQIAVDVATALEYLHFYCDPPVCHRDIKSSNVLLDENFVAKVADFGLAHPARAGTNNFEPINTAVRGTPGYMDPEYVITRELTDKSDIYSYGVLLLELITARQAVHENKNLVEWSQKYMTTCSRLPEMVDPDLSDTYDFAELENLVMIAKMCTQREGKARPSIKQVLQVLYDRLGVSSCNGMMPTQDNDANNGNVMAINSEKTEKARSTNEIDLSDELRCSQSSPSTSRSYCSRSFLLESGSPHSPVSASVSA